jgi:hypothetical protein
VNESPLEALLESFDRLDIEGVMALLAPDPQFLLVDGRRADGAEEVRELVTSLVSDLRSTAHRIVSQWHQDDVWIAEVEADYELADWLQRKALPRAVFVRHGPDGISELHVYGAHERPIAEHRTGEEGMWLGDRWIPPL